MTRRVHRLGSFAAYRASSIGCPMAHNWTECMSWCLLTECIWSTLGAAKSRLVRCLTAPQTWHQRGVARRHAIRLEAISHCIDLLEKFLVGVCAALLCWTLSYFAASRQITLPAAGCAPLCFALETHHRFCRDVIPPCGFSCPWQFALRKASVGQNHNFFPSESGDLDQNRGPRCTQCPSAAACCAQ